jgi:hypothetical protein
MLGRRTDSFGQARRDAQSAGAGARFCYVLLNAFVLGTLGATQNELTAEISRGDYSSAIVYARSSRSQPFVVGMTFWTLLQVRSAGSGRHRALRIYVSRRSRVRSV